MLFRSALSAQHGWLPEQILPPPQDVARMLAEWWHSGELLDHLRISLQRVLGGFALGTGLGLSLGLLMGLSPLAKDYLAPSFKAFAQVPVLGWLPFLMLLVGIDEALKWLLIAKAAMVPVTLNTLAGVENVPPRYLEVARVLRLGTWQTLSRVVLPAAFAPIWTGVRHGLTHAWLALVVVELLASSEGLGYMIVFYLMPAQGPFLLRALHANPGLTGLMLGSSTLMAAVTSLVFSRFAGRFDPRRLAGLGMVVVALGWLLVFRAPGLASA